MVHGACSSSGCYALTDQGVGEIYAVVSKGINKKRRASTLVNGSSLRSMASNDPATRCS